MRHPPRPPRLRRSADNPPYHHAHGREYRRCRQLGLDDDQTSVLVSSRIAPPVVATWNAREAGFWRNVSSVQTSIAPDGLPESTQIGLGVGIGAGGVLLVAFAGGLFWNRRRKRERTGGEGHLVGKPELHSESKEVPELAEEENAVVEAGGDAKPTEADRPHVRVELEGNWCGWEAPVSGPQRGADCASTTFIGTIISHHRCLRKLRAVIFSSIVCRFHLLCMMPHIRRFSPCLLKRTT